MIDHRVLTELTAHYHHAANKHPAFTDPNDVVARLQDRLTKLVSAIGSTTDPDCNAQIGRRLMQTAAIAIRATVNLAYPVAPPKEPPLCDPSPSEK